MSDPQTWSFAGLPALLWIPLLPLLASAINLFFGKRSGKPGAGVRAVLAVAGACVLAGVEVFGGLFYHATKEAPPLWQAGGSTQTAWSWLEVGGFKAELAFRLDSLSAVMILIITFIGSLIHIYSAGYMAHDPRYSAFFGYLNLFTGSMLILVLAANLPVMFIGWEGVGLCSFLLIGFWYENDAYAYAGRKAFVVNRIGDFMFLLGMFLLYWAVKSLDFNDIKNAANITVLHDSVWGPHNSHVWADERLAAAAGICLFGGASGKRAQLPLFVWLPDAMAGPTPVSARIHAATMVTAGVYMVCRLSFLYSISTTAMIVISTVGLLTALVAAFIAFAQTDLKKVLAYSTVSQLGFMFVAAGTGNYTAAVFHLGTHAFFKACLFLGAGSVMHGMEHGGSTTPGDITTMGGLRKHMPITRATFLISCLAISGIFPFAGFFSKDEILGSACYMWRLYFLVFSGNERSEAAKHAHESPASMTSALAILALFATIIGFIGVPHLEALHGIPSALHALWVEGPLAGPYEASKNKLWFDELYDATIVRPFKMIARGLFEIADRFVIDTVAVNGAAFVVSLFSRLSRWVQNGQVQRYLSGLVVGAAAVFLVPDCHRPPAISISRQGEALRLHAEHGAGIVGPNVKLHWHLDGSTDCSADKDKPSDPPDLTVRRGDVGGRVALCIDDAIGRKMNVVTAEVPTEETP